MNLPVIIDTPRPLKLGDVVRSTQDGMYGTVIRMSDSIVTVYFPGRNSKIARTLSGRCSYFYDNPERLAKLGIISRV